MKAYPYIMAALALVALAACKDEVEQDYTSDPNAVHLHATIGANREGKQQKPASNPTGDNTIATQFSSGDEIAVSTNQQAAVTYRYDGTAWAPTDADTYLTWESKRMHFTAYYPTDYTGTALVPADQSTITRITQADYMHFAGEREKASTVSLSMARQTARVVINSEVLWGAEYLDINNQSIYRLESIRLHCVGTPDIQPYHADHYYALVNPHTADPAATFLTLNIAPVADKGEPMTYTVQGIPAFEAGYSYTYNLTIGKNGITLTNVVVEDWSTGNVINGEGSADDEVEFVFSVSTLNFKPFTYAGGTQTYEVRSFVSMANGDRIALPWTAAVVRPLEDGGYEPIQPTDDDYPTWMSGLVTAGIGDIPEQECAITVEPAEISNQHHDALRNNPPVSGIYNLANATGSEAVENTANCYIINAAGTYSLPLVYGNAIKNGTDNPAAYVSNATGVNALENFVNHNNAPITSPYIAAHEGCVPDNAVLVWQDAENLVSNIQFVDGGTPEAHRITFDVSQATLKQGNAIIALRDTANTILWSWHIWVTDYQPLLPATITATYDPTQTPRDKVVWNYNNTSSCTMMGVPLGWCDAESAAGREAIVLFTQPETGNTQVITIKQEPLAAGGNCTFYQWGRKDPMLPSTGLGNEDKPHTGEYLYIKNGEGKASIGKSIQNPHTFYNFGGSGYYDWCSNSGTMAGKSFLFNLWDTHNNTINNESNSSSVTAKYTATTKTVYDPSPVGYVVPTNGAMSGFTFNGQMTGGDWSYNRKQFNSPIATKEEAVSVNGWIFYCKGMNSRENQWNADGGVIYYPATGFRNFYEGGEVQQIGNVGYYWEAVPHVNAISYHSGFEIERAIVFPGDGITYRPNGSSVRPIRE